MNAHDSWFAGTPEASREQKVDAGLAFLDEKFGSEKVNGVDLERLDIENAGYCMLSQLTDALYKDALRMVGLGNEQAALYGLISLDFDDLRRVDNNQRFTAIFRRKIQQRRALVA